MPGISFTTSLNSSGVTAGLNKIKAGVASLGSSMSSLAGIVGLAGIGAFLKSSITYVGDLQDLAERVGLTAMQMQILGAVARENGSDVDQATMAIQKLNGVLGEARNGSELANAKLKAIGFSMADIANPDAENSIRILGTALRNATPGSIEYSRVMQIFGERVGPKVAMTIKQMADGFESAKSGLSGLQKFASDEDVARIDKATDRIASYYKSLQVWAAEVAISFIDTSKVIYRELKKIDAVGRGGPLPADTFEKISKPGGAGENLQRQTFIDQKKIAVAESARAKTMERAANLNSSTSEMEKKIDDWTSEKLKQIEDDASAERASMADKKKSAIKSISDISGRSVSMNVDELTRVGGGLSGGYNSAQQQAQKTLEYQKEIRDILKEFPSKIASEIIQATTLGE